MKQPRLRIGRREARFCGPRYRSLARDLTSRDKPLKGEATLILTENGWIHGALLGE